MVDGEYKLSIAIKACKYLVGPDDIVPKLLLCGVIPRLLIRPTPLPDRTACMRALYAVRIEMRRLTTQARVYAALRHNAPVCADSPLYFGDQVLWYRDKPVGKWTGFFVFTGMGDALARVDNGGRQIATPIDSLKRYHAPKLAPPPNNAVVTEDDNTTLYPSIYPTARTEGNGVPPQAMPPTRPSNMLKVRTGDGPTCG